MSNELRSEVTKAATKRWQLRLKQKTIDAYGGKCSCCGETELAFLTLEHTNRDGKEHRAANGGTGGNPLYHALFKQGYPQDIGLDVLCFNCNHVSAWMVCPHKSGVPLRSQIPASQRREKGKAEHGTITMYQSYKCRCEPCRTAYREHRKGRY